MARMMHANFDCALHKILNVASVASVVAKPHNGGSVLLVLGREVAMMMAGRVASRGHDWSAKAGLDAASDNNNKK